MLDDLLKDAERQAIQNADGHLTLYRFTTGWKAFWGTPDIFELDRDSIFAASTFPTAEAAIAALVARPLLFGQGDPLLDV